jgi:Mg-chelatase subunit ChlD
MEKKHQVHNLIILDESGSMASIKHTIIAGFNELVQTIKGIEKQYPEQEHFISLVSFNGLGIKTLHLTAPVSKLEQIDDSNYRPDASTPLFDAIGYTLNEGIRILRDKTDYNVLVTILTDGEENASREYSGATIKKMIEELKQQNWTFTYIGTDHDVDKIADSIAINNKMRFEKNQEDIQFMFEKERYAREEYSRKIRMKEDLISDFYEKTKEERANEEGN